MPSKKNSNAPAIRWCSSALISLIPSKYTCASRPNTNVASRKLSIREACIGLPLQMFADPDQPRAQNTIGLKHAHLAVGTKGAAVP